MKAKRSFTPRLKDEAVSRVLDQCYKVSDVCGQLDIGENMFMRWIKKMKFERDCGRSWAGALTP